MTGRCFAALHGESSRLHIDSHVRSVFTAPMPNTLLFACLGSPA